MTGSAFTALNVGLRVFTGGGPGGERGVLTIDQPVADDGKRSESLAHAVNVGFWVITGWGSRGRVGAGLGPIGGWRMTGSAFSGWTLYLGLLLGKKSWEGEVWRGRGRSGSRLRRRLADFSLRCFQVVLKVLVWDGIVLLLEAVLEGDLEPSWRCFRMTFGWSSGPGNAFRCRVVLLFRAPAGVSPDAPQTAEDGPDGPPGRATGGSLTAAFWKDSTASKVGISLGRGADFPLLEAFSKPPKCPPKASQIPPK